jgi:rfaE bifunctional protein nucleotidyltransferase chain/domain
MVDLDAAWRLRREWRKAGHRVVFTNGCFDLLHVGHVRYLAVARGLGDRLVVAVNDDESARRLKGKGRPLLPLAERMEMLAALRFVDLVLAFGGPTAVDVVLRLQPDLYVKGGDYSLPGRRPPEADAAAGCGAQVMFVPYQAGYSTTDLVDRFSRLRQ